MTALRKHDVARAKIGRRGTATDVKQTAPVRTAEAFVEAARVAGLLEGDRAEHLSFRAPAALVAAAKRETGIESTTELGIAALAALAQPDPVAAFLKRTRGRLAGLPPIEP